MMAALTILLSAGSVQAQVLWEDYRGTNAVAADADYIGTPGAPKFANSPNSGAMAPFRALAANPANAARIGSSPNIDFRGTDTNTLCNSLLGLGTTACRYQAQGRALYALIQFPAAGSYTLRAAHDDNLVVELSTDFANTNYRNASYDIPVGTLAEWTANDTTFETVGTFTAANANSCALIRVFWTNQNGLNHNRLQWTRPGGMTQIVPAENFRDPSLASSAEGCNGSINGSARAITLNKVLGSQRADASDQFTIQIGTTAAGGMLRQATTAGSGTGSQASTGAHIIPAASATYYLRETMAPGSASTFDAYQTTLSCTRNGAPLTPAPVAVITTPTMRAWSITMETGTNNQAVCTITNTARPSVTVSKTSLGTTGTFAFTGTNGIAAHSIATATPGTPVAGPRYVLTTAGAVTTITEGVPPAGFVLSDITCTGLGSGTATPNLGTRTVSLNAAATAMGNAIECTFTNRRLEADLSITKTNTPGLNGDVDQAGDVLLTGQQTTYDIIVRHAGGDTVADAVLRDPAPTGLSSCVLAAPACTATGTATCPVEGAAAGQLSIANLQSASATGGVRIPSMAAGSSVTVRITCTVD